MISAQQLDALDPPTRQAMLSLMAEIRAKDALIAQRDRYESLWTALIGALPLVRRTDRKALRLMLLGALNWAQTWYRPAGAATPRTIARQFTALLRQGKESLP